MKVQAKQGSKEVFDIDGKIARALIAAGTHVEYIAPEPVRVPCTTWAAGWLPAQLGIPREPAITAKCTTCSGAATLTGPTAHRTQVFRHCGVVENIPRDVSAQYAGMRKQMAEDEKARIDRARVKVPHFANKF